MRLIFILLCSFSFSYGQRICVNKLQWSTEEGQILVNGQPLVLKGINYGGFETESYAPAGLSVNNLDFYLDFVMHNNFNAIRVPFSLYMVKINPRQLNLNCSTREMRILCGKSALELLDFFIERSAERGLLVMLDNNRITPRGGSSELWYNVEYPEEEVIKLLRHLTDRYKHSWNVFAIDLKNENHDSATWGNSSEATDWNKGAERIISSISSSFSGLFFVGGIDWGSNFKDALEFPIDTGSDLLNNRIVYSPHCFGRRVYDTPERKMNRRLDRINGQGSFYMQWEPETPEIQMSQPVVIGSWGGQVNAGSRDKFWHEWYVEWLRIHCLTNNFYQTLITSDGGAGGVLEADCTTPVELKLQLLTHAQPNPTKFLAQSGKLCIAHGVFPEEHCRIGGKVTTLDVDISTASINTSLITDISSLLEGTPPPKYSDSYGVTVTAVLNRSWMEGGIMKNNYTLRFAGSAGVPKGEFICGIHLNIYGDILETRKLNHNDEDGPVYYVRPFVDARSVDEKSGFISRGDSTVELNTVHLSC